MFSLKILCTLVRLCEGNFLLTLRLNCVGLTFPHILAYNFHFSLFVGRTTEQIERRADLMSVLCSPIVRPPQPPLPTFPSNQ